MRTPSLISVRSVPEISVHLHERGHKHLYIVDLTGGLTRSNVILYRDYLIRWRRDINMQWNCFQLKAYLPPIASSHMSLILDPSTSYNFVVMLLIETGLVNYPGAY